MHGTQVRWAGLGILTSPKTPRHTLQWQDAHAEVFQLAEGADEVKLVLDGPRTVSDQLETRPDKDNMAAMRQNLAPSEPHFHFTSHENVMKTTRQAGSGAATTGRL